MNVGEVGGGSHPQVPFLMGYIMQDAERTNQEIMRNMKI